MGQLTSTVPYLNLIYTDKALEQFDTNLKVMPPLRKKSDQQELIKGGSRKAQLMPL